MSRREFKKTRDDVIRLMELRRSGGYGIHQQKTDRQQWRKKKLNKRFDQED